MASQDRKLTYKKKILKIYTQKFSLNCKPNNVYEKQYLHPIANQLTDYPYQYLEIYLLDQALRNLLLSIHKYCALYLPNLGF